MRQTRRANHTRVGWWLMTHERGGAAVLGGCALIVLVADLSYAMSHWTGSFPRSFSITLVGLTICLAVMIVLRLDRPIGSDRQAARRNQRGTNLVLVTMLVAFLGLGNRVGGNSAAEILGSVAGLAAGFALYTGAWLMRKHA